MDPQGQIAQAKEISQSLHSDFDPEDPDAEISMSDTSDQDSDYSYSLDLRTRQSRRLIKVKSPNGISSHRLKKKGKQGLKYAKISNVQREELINKVQSTGCTIKSAALELNINFSTAKAIMQIFKKEGRSCKKIIRKNRKRRCYLLAKRTHSKELRSQTSAPNVKLQPEQVVVDKKILKQEDDDKSNTVEILKQVEDLQVNTLRQAQIIQQLTQQNCLLQGQINGYQQEKIQMSQNLQYALNQLCQYQQYTQQFPLQYSVYNALMKPNQFG